MDNERLKSYICTVEQCGVIRFLPPSWVGKTVIVVDIENLKEMMLKYEV